MPVSVRVLPSRDLVVVTYSGSSQIAETEKAVSQYLGHPDYRPNHRHLVDVSRVTDVEHDFGRFMALQAKLLEVRDVRSAHDMLVVYYAPNEAGQKMASMALRSWRDVEGTVISIVEDEASALALLGLKEQSIDELLNEPAQR